MMVMPDTKHRMEDLGRQVSCLTLGSLVGLFSQVDIVYMLSISFRRILVGRLFKSSSVRKTTSGYLTVHKWLDPV